MTSLCWACLRLTASRLLVSRNAPIETVYYSTSTSWLFQQVLKMLPRGVVKKLIQMIWGDCTCGKGRRARSHMWVCRVPCRLVMNGLRGCWSVLGKHHSYRVAEKAHRQPTYGDTYPRDVASWSGGGVRRRRPPSSRRSLLAPNWPRVNLTSLLVRETMIQQRMWAWERASDLI